MAKMLISVVVDADRGTLAKIKNRFMFAAHRHIVSSQFTILEPVPAPLAYTEQDRVTSDAVRQIKAYFERED